MTSPQRDEACQALLQSRCQKLYQNTQCMVESSSNAMMLSVIKELSGLSRTDLEAVAKLCRWRQYDAGEEIIRYQDTTTNTFFVITGEIRVTYYSPSGHEVILCDLAPGSIFGELTAIDGESRSATVIARERSLIASIAAPAFLSLIHSNQALCTAVLKRLTSQIRRLTARVLDFSTLNVNSRIHVELLRLAREVSADSNTVTLSPAPKHSDLANLVSTHREAVTRELNNLVRLGLIRREANNLVIIDMKKMGALVNQVRGCCDMQ